MTLVGAMLVVDSQLYKPPTPKLTTFAECKRQWLEGDDASAS
jgi:hypothetical protein